MTKPNLKVVGEIGPPPYKDPVKMLRNIAKQIEKGEYEGVTTIVVALWGDDGVATFGGGKDSDMFHCSYLFGVAQARLQNIPIKDDEYD